MSVDYDASFMYGVILDKDSLEDLIKKYSGRIYDGMDDDEVEETCCEYMEEFYSVCEVINNYVDYDDAEFYMGITLPDYMTEEQMRTKATNAINDFWPKVVDVMFPNMPTDIAIKTFKPAFQVILRIW